MPSVFIFKTLQGKCALLQGILKKGEKMKNVLSLVFAAVFCFSGASAVSAPDTLPLTVAHRGAPDFAPENTLAGFEIAQAQGVQAVECDLHLTADGKLAVLHDERAGRVWSADIAPAESTLAELQALRPSAGFRAAFPRAVNERIPAFCDVVECLRSDMRIFAELKTAGRAAADALIAEIRRLKIEERTTVISFSRETVDYLCGQGIDCAWLVSCERGADVLALDIPAGAALDVNMGALTAQTVQILHGRGITVYCWAAVGKADYEAMAAMGVDGVTADNFEFLKKR